MRTPTGIKRLDDLLDGGIEEHAAALVYGPPFSGKAILSKLFVTAGLRMGVPAIVLLTDHTVHDYRKDLIAIDSQFEQYERSGLVQYVDVYSRSIGAADDFPHAIYADGPVNINSVAIALNEAQRNIIGDHDGHRIVFESVSTMMAYTNPQTTFRFLQVLLGKAKLAGATSVLSMQEGMHEAADVQMIKHLASGVVQMGTENGTNRLRIEGFDLMTNPGWVEYRFNRTTLEITGSFSAGRIR